MIDGDGAIDMVFPVCRKKTGCAIHIAYNKQKPLCTSSNQINCRKISNLCEPDDNFRFNFKIDPVNDVNYSLTFIVIIITLITIIELKKKKKIFFIYWKIKIPGI